MIKPIVDLGWLHQVWFPSEWKNQDSNVHKSQQRKGNIINRYVC